MEIMKSIDNQSSTLNRDQIRDCLREGVINIEPFRPSALRKYAYRLFPHTIRVSRRDNKGQLLSSEVSLDENGFSLEPRQHCVVSIEETVMLSPGLLGTIFPSSNCIELGVVLTVGRIEPGYTRAIVLGVFNAGQDSLELHPGFELARLAFMPVRPVRDTEPGDYEEPGDYIEGVSQMRRVGGKQK